MASRFSAVSIRFSPLTVLLEDPEILITSALNLLPAISNEVRVLVLGSKNKLIIVFPRNAGTFLIGRVDISLKESAVSKIVVISPWDRHFVPKIFLRLNITDYLLLERLLCKLHPYRHLLALEPAHG